MTRKPVGRSEAGRQWLRREARYQTVSEFVKLFHDDNSTYLVRPMRRFFVAELHGRVYALYEVRQHSRKPAWRQELVCTGLRSLEAVKRACDAERPPAFGTVDAH